MYRFKKGFTLAEVLITLGIIGVVAALTLPALIASYQKQQTVTQLKKAYSALNQAVKLASLDYDEFEYKGSAQEDAKAYLEQYFLPYLKTVKVCIPIENCGIDWQDYKFLNGELTSTSMGIRATAIGAVLSDGSVFIVCPFGNYYPFYLDVNGKKGPNILGKDLFRFGRSDMIIPSEGIKLDGQGLSREELTAQLGTTSNGCSSGATGKYCGALIMHDGWEIRDDYPW
jgi:prepilin-type N-terminal cleavage/methylation domain-containing protein